MAISVTISVSELLPITKKASQLGLRRQQRLPQVQEGQTVPRDRPGQHGADREAGGPVRRRHRHGEHTRRGVRRLRQSEGEGQNSSSFKDQRRKALADPEAAFAAEHECELQVPQEALDKAGERSFCTVISNMVR